MAATENDYFIQICVFCYFSMLKSLLLGRSIPFQKKKWKWYWCVINCTEMLTTLSVYNDANDTTDYGDQIPRGTRLFQCN